MGGLDLSKLTSFFSPGDANPLPSSQVALPGECPPRVSLLPLGGLELAPSLMQSWVMLPVDLEMSRARKPRSELDFPQLVRDPGDLSHWVCAPLAEDVLVSWCCPHTRCPGDTGEEWGQQGPV